MKLYHHPLSTFSRRVRMQILEKGLEVEEVVVDLKKREHKSLEYLQLNPYGRVPTLVDDDFVLYESSAIMEYLEARFPQRPLTPADIRGRALVTMHIKLCDLELASHTRSLFFPRRFLPRERWDLPAMDAAVDVIARHLAILERELGDKPYLLGDDYGLADIAYTPFIEPLPKLDIGLPPRVAKWAKRLTERPSALATATAI